jgi:hypothetical protein
MFQITFPKAIARKRKKKGMFFRFDPHFARCLEVEARRKGMTQADYLQTCMALHGCDAEPGLAFRFEMVKVTPPARRARTGSADHSGEQK